jgi:two-component system sensor kinase FixL
LIMENVQDYAILILDVEGRIMTWNAGAERITGYGAEEVIGKHFALFYLRDEVERGRPEEILKTAAADGRWEEEGWRLRKDGSRYWSSVVLTPLWDRPGCLRGFIKVTRDVTARKEIEEKLRYTERLAAIGEMITGLAHESRNALQRAQACLELLQLKADDRPDLLELTADIEKAQDHLRYLFDEVRGYASPIRLSLRRADLGKLLRETWQQLDQSRAGRDARIEEKSQHFDLNCLIDPVALGQVLRNILENSLSMCPDPVIIRVEWAEVTLKGRSAVRISLRDNGPGFTPEARTRLFEPFFTTKTQGTGLGMAIAKRIVATHGGDIAVGSHSLPGAEIEVTVLKEGP